MGNRMRAVIISVMLTPFQSARLVAARDYFAARGDVIRCLEVASQQDLYRHFAGRDERRPEWVETVFPGETYEAISPMRLTREVARRLAHDAPDVVVIGGWTLYESWAALRHCLAQGAACVVVSDTTEQDRRH